LRDFSGSPLIFRPDLISLYGIWGLPDSLSIEDSTAEGSLKSVFTFVGGLFRGGFKLFLISNIFIVSTISSSILETSYAFGLFNYGV